MKRETVYRIFSHIPTLETERLILRRMQVADAEDMFSYAQRADVTRYLAWPPHKSVAYTREYLQYLGQRYRIGSFFDWALEDKATHRMIGTCGFTAFDCVNNSCEIGYVLHPDYHGKGYASEAARRVLSFAFDTLGVQRAEAKYIVGNDASRRVMEAIGMTFEGIRRGSVFIKGAYRDIGVCAILASDRGESSAQHKRQKDDT